MTSQTFKYHIDSPQPNTENSSPFIFLQGWVIARSPISNLIVQDNQDTRSYPLTTAARPDVELAFPDYYVLGFQQYFSIIDIPPNINWIIKFEIDGNHHSFPISFQISELLYKDFVDKKAKKLETLKEVLRCPICENEKLSYLEATINCPSCSSQFDYDSSSYKMINQDLIEYSKIKPTSNVSSNGYDRQTQSIIQQFENGLILDNGSGLRRNYYGNVVNLEIVDYPTTDVVGVGEKLPFKSNIFDAIFSIAVLEHVKNPFENAKEIARVLKPGGVLYVAVPFLQPFHGYPDHYYNMTSSGLKNLFYEDLQIVEAGIPLSGLPIWSLSWFLNSYIQGLPQSTAEKFKNMKVSDLLAHPQQYLEQDFVQQLSPNTNEELACGTFLVAKKPSI